MGKWGLSTYIWVGVMLIAGTFSGVTTKTVMCQTSEGADGTVHSFNKPWMESIFMFLAMSLCLIIYFVDVACQKRKRGPELRPLLNEPHDPKDVVDDGAPKVDRRVYYYIAVPALFDLIGSTLATVGVLWVSASVYQMLRGSLTLFSCLLSIFFLKRKIHGYQWLGVALCTIALVMVGVSSAVDPNNAGDTGSSDVGMMILGMLLIVAGQAVGAGQIVAEDFLMSSIQAPPFLVVGMEGVWGLISTVIFLVILQYTPLPAGCDLNLPDGAANQTLACSAAHLYHEDTWDSLVMLTHSTSLVLVCLAFAASILFYNMGGMKVTQHLATVARTIFESVRTLGIWLFDLLLWYAWPSVRKSSSAEQWDEWSWLQLGGFIILLLGTAIYNNAFKVPGFRYDDAPKPAAAPAPPKEPTTAV